MKCFYSFPSGRWLIALLFLVGHLQPARGQAPAWQTAIALANATAVDASQVAATALDASGNVYIVGKFNGTVRFGNTSLTGTPINPSDPPGSARNDDMFVAKWSPATQGFVWALRAGGPLSDLATSVAVSGSSVYVVGSFVGTADFGQTTLTSIPQAYADLFVTKISDAGTSAVFTWALRAGGAASDVAQAVAVSGTSVYVAGNFLGTADFGTRRVTSAGNQEAFVAKLTDLGPSADFTWVQRAGGIDADYAYALATNGNDVYMAGNYYGVASFGNITLSSNYYHAFVAKLTDAGPTSSFVWAEEAGASTSVAYALVVSGANVYVTGNFANQASFGSTILAVPNGSGLATDVFVAKLTDAGTSGHFVWAQRAGGPGGDTARALAVSGNDLYVAGVFNSSASFGSTTLNSLGSGNLFVTKLTDDGSTSRFAWAQGAYDTYTVSATSVAVTGSQVVIGGQFQGTANFGNITITQSTTNFVGLFALLQTGTGLATRSTSLLEGMGLFPNPAQTAVMLHLPTKASVSEARVVLLDAAGRPVRTTTVHLFGVGTAYILNVQGLAPGVYVLHVQVGEDMAVRRLTVE